VRSGRQLQAWFIFIPRSFAEIDRDETLYGVYKVQLKHVLESAVGYPGIQAADFFALF
jgi:hypothetical protein